jgi:hypothetical protein
VVFLKVLNRDWLDDPIESVFSNTDMK